MTTEMREIKNVDFKNIKHRLRYNTDLSLSLY